MSAPPTTCKRELDRIGHKLKPLDIVLVNTAAGAYYGKPEFLDKGCGMGREATLFLTRQGVRVTGTDGWSWDAPFSFTAKRFAETRMRRSSGKATRPAARSAIATWRSSAISSSCRRTAFRCRASR